MPRSARTITVYPVRGEKFDILRQRDGLTEVLDESLLRPRGGNDSVNFHERIIRTYHELECSGQLKEMGPREKQRIRDVHTYAQNPHYWPSDYTKEERGI